MNMLGLAKRTHARFLLTSTSEASALEALPRLPCRACLASQSFLVHAKPDVSVRVPAVIGWEYMC